LGFKPDGTSYKFVVSPLGMSVVFWTIVVRTCDSQLKMAGCEASIQNPEVNLEQQIAIMEDAITNNVDGICLYPVDTAGTGPIVDTAWDNGIPTFVMDTECDSDNVVAFHSFDALEKCRIVGRAMIDYAEANNVNFKVYELFCPMSVDT
jgi:ABC-type sugar transport system substrate-binding protein